MILTINQGKIRGKEERSKLTGKKYYSFIGIPYAKPPIGDLRFKPPQKANGWPDTFEAVNEGNVCIQSGREPKDLFGNEDCLYLNVFTPVVPSCSTKPRPVMVNVHGGGFFSFSGSVMSSSPDNLIDYNVVLVTFNYRLSVLGFLNLGLPECPGNVGLKDQLMAFQWVKDNIERFGGDVNNITAFGQSAGASSIHLHALSPLSRDLFHKCILQSGYALSTWSFCEHPVERAFELGAMLGYQGADKQELLNFLKQTPANELIEATRALKAELRKRYPGICTAYPFLPSVETIREGAILTDHPRLLLKNMRKMPVMMGVVNKEGANMFIKESKITAILRKQFDDVVRINVPADENKLHLVVEKIKQFYFVDGRIGINSVNEIADLYTDLYFKDFYDFQKCLLETSEYPLYVYQYCFTGKLNPFPVQPGLDGAIHGAEHFYLFGSNFFYQNPFFAIPKEDISVIKKMCTLWTNFAKSGNPNTPRAPVVMWEPTLDETPCYLKIDNTLEMKTGKVNEQRYSFWQTLAEYTRM